MATRSRGRCILSSWTPGSLSGSLTCPYTTHTRKDFTRSRSPFPVGDKEENINKQTPTISRSQIKITNTQLTPNLNPSSAVVRGRAESIPVELWTDPQLDSTPSWEANFPTKFHLLVQVWPKDKSPLTIFNLNITFLILLRLSSVAFLNQAFHPLYG